MIWFSKKKITLITKQSEFCYIVSRIQAVRARKNSLWLQLKGFPSGGGAKDTLGSTTNLDWTYAEERCYEDF